MGSQLPTTEPAEVTDVHSLDALRPQDPALRERRRRLVRVVVATVGGCALILVAAAVAHWARASPAVSSDPIVIASHPTAAASAPPPAASTSSTPGVDPNASAAPNAAPTTGVLHIHRPALPGHVWLDGARIKTTTTTVDCGQHRVKVGSRGHTHVVDVPCGGELRVSR